MAQTRENLTLVILQLVFIFVTSHVKAAVVMMQCDCDKCLAKRTDQIFAITQPRVAQ